MGIVAAALLSEGYWIAGRALIHLQMMITPDDQRAAEMLMSINQSADVPLMIKDDRTLRVCAADAPWQGPFIEALKPVERGDWATACQRFHTSAADDTDNVLDNTPGHGKISGAHGGKP